VSSVGLAHCGRQSQASFLASADLNVEDRKGNFTVLDLLLSLPSCLHDCSLHLILGSLHFSTHSDLSPPSPKNAAPAPSDPPINRHSLHPHPPLNSQSPPITQKPLSILLPLLQQPSSLSPQLPPHPHSQHHARQKRRPQLGQAPDAGRPLPRTTYERMGTGWARERRSDEGSEGLCKDHDASADCEGVGGGGAEGGGEGGGEGGEDE